MRSLLRGVALCCAFIALSAQARPFNVDDLLHVDRRGEVGISPDGRWLIISVVRGQAKVARFDYDATYPFAARRLYRVDLDHPGAATPLLEEEDTAGYTAGPFSPDGQRVIVSRLRGHEWEAGIVDIATGQTRWLGVGLEFPLFGRGAQWRSNREIVAIVTPVNEPHVLFRRGWQRSQFEAQARGLTAERGGPSVLSIGSGRYLARGAAGPRKTLAKIDAATGSVTAVATGDFIDLEVSPSGRFVAAYRYGVDLQPHESEAVTGATDSRQRELVVADLAMGKVLHGCPRCDISPFLMSWSPVGDRLMVFTRNLDDRRAEGQLTIATPRSDRIDVRSVEGARPTILTTHDGLELINAGWVGQNVALLGRPVASTGTSSTWLKVDHGHATPLLPSSVPPSARLVADDKGRLFAASGGSVVRVRGGKASPAEAASLAPSTILGETGRPLLGQLRTGADMLVRRRGRLVRLDASGEQDLGPLDDMAILVSRGGAVVTAARDAHGVETLSVRRNGAVTTVLTLNPQLAEVDFGEVRPVHHRGPRGEDLVSWVELPPNWKKDSPPPLVVLPYPGRAPYSAASPPELARPGTGLYSVSSQVLAGQGYAVLYPSLPRDLYPNDPAKDLAAQVLDVVDAVGAAGLADTTRVGLWGHSFGGHAALAAATQSPRFKAIIVTSGVADLVSAWGTYVVQTTPDEGLSLTARGSYFESGQMRVGGTPWTTTDRYIANSPLFQADKITAPVLLAYGDLDEYSDGQGGEMFAALYRQGKDARLLTFWGEGHVITAPGNVRRLYQEALGWLDRAFAKDASPDPGQPRTP